MSDPVLLENLETHETMVLHPNPDGTYPNFKLPWMVKGAVLAKEQVEAIVKKREEKKVVTVNVDDKLNAIAAMLLIPVADVLHVVGQALGLNCAYCQLRYQIWQKAQELGWWKVLYLTAKSIKAQVQHDEAAIKKMAKELE